MGTENIPRVRRTAPVVGQWAKENRQRATTAEAILWEALRDRRLDGAKFRRQHPVGTFILDFWCSAQRLAVELDGQYHDLPDQKQRDAARDAWIRRHGVRLLRFQNEEVLEKLPDVLARIRDTLTP